MAKNHEKYAYIHLALLKASPVYDALMAEAEASGTPPANIILVRLAERYGLTSSATIAPVAPAEQPREVAANMSQADLNAAAALDAWPD